MGKSSCSSLYSKATATPRSSMLCSVLSSRPVDASITCTWACEYSSAALTRPSNRGAMASTKSPRTCSSSAEVLRNDASSWLSSTSKGTVPSANHTMPHLETVASVACLSVSTSIITRTLGGILSRSPEGSVSTLLSSSTLLRFSAQSGSTSPSNTIQLRRTPLNAAVSITLLSILVNTPSVHSSVLGSREPYSLSLSTLLGSMT
mmetsp:Transcript_4796/g.10883  ORF Transcript_4796/g.10883 Transcript_4796/m.10883 type:complete len:205 (-) Transcript_4796:856-1470(-)